RRHTRSKRDWSSDVCSSDLLHRAVGDRRKTGGAWGKSDDEVLAAAREWATLADAGAASEATGGRIRGPLREAEEAQEETERAWRSEERRVGKECRSRGGR